LQIDEEFELGGLHDREVPRFGAFEDAPGINSDLPKGVSKIRSVTHEAADFDILPCRIACGQAIPRRQRGKLDAPGAEKSITEDEQGVCSMARSPACRAHAAGGVPPQSARTR
jgi:hypothetical protein